MRDVDGRFIGIGQLETLCAAARNEGRYDACFI